MSTTVNVLRQDAVKRAALILDREVPGWHRKMRPEKLHMGNTNLCALGQLFGRDVEMSIAKELYPAEWMRHGGGTRSGFAVGIDFLMQRFLGHDLTKMSWPIAYSKTDSQQKKAEAQFLLMACGRSDDLRCYWAEEVADRCAKEEADAL